LFQSRCRDSFIGKSEADVVASHFAVSVPLPGFFYWKAHLIQGKNDVYYPGEFQSRCRDSFIGKFQIAAMLALEKKEVSVPLPGFFYWKGRLARPIVSWYCRVSVPLPGFFYWKGLQRSSAPIAHQCGFQSRCRDSFIGKSNDSETRQSTITWFQSRCRDSFI